QEYGHSVGEFSPHGFYLDVGKHLLWKSYQAGRAALQSQPLTVDALAQEIRRVNGNNALGAGALAEALMPFLESALQSQDAEITAYALPSGISVERSMQSDGTYLWGVRDRIKKCLSKSGTWYYEPFPSSRTEEWLDP